MRYIILASFLLISSTKLLAKDVYLEGRVSFFYPTSKTTRTIMGNGALYAIESTFQANKYLYPWLSVGILPNWGHSIGERDKTSMILIPIGAGLKLFYPFGPSRIYLGVGHVAGYLHTHNHTTTVPSRSRWDLGVYFKSGYIYTAGAFFFDIFFDYLLLRVHSSDSRRTLGRTADVSGLSIGAGLGYKF